jgi:hypothetical protein
MRHPHIRHISLVQLKAEPAKDSSKDHIEFSMGQAVNVHSSQQAIRFMCIAVPIKYSLDPKTRPRILPERHEIAVERRAVPRPRVVEPTLRRE